MANLKKQKGVAIVYVVLMTSVIFAIALGINSISYQQSKTMGEIGNSVVAFYAADTGAERILFNLYKTASPASSTSDILSDTSYYTGRYTATAKCSTLNTNCAATPLIPQDPNCNDPKAFNYCVYSIGESKGGVRRAVELRY